MVYFFQNIHVASKEACVSVILVFFTFAIDDCMILNVVLISLFHLVHAQPIQKIMQFRWYIALHKQLCFITF